MSLLDRIKKKGFTSAADALRTESGAKEPATSGKSLPKRPENPNEFSPREMAILASVRDRVFEKIGRKAAPTSADPNAQRDYFTAICQKELSAQLADGDYPMSIKIQNRILDDLMATLLGFGKIQILLDDKDVSEVMVNGPHMIYFEKKGKIVLSDVKFHSDEDVMNVIQRIVSPLGRRCDTSSPLVDARLPDGSRVNAIIPPLALNGPTITIRKFSEKKFDMYDLVEFGSLTRDMADFLKACVHARLNIVVSGGTGSGKTTTLNALSCFIPEDERIITIEDSAELRLLQDHVVSLETRPPNIEGKGEITIRELVKNSLRMRPERIVIGECRGGECLDMLQAMNTGHDGSLTTAHANTPVDAVSRMEIMVMMAGMDLPIRNVREQIASAVDVVIQQSRLTDGSRKITYVTEVIGMNGENVETRDIFRFEQEGIDSKGKVIGALRPTGQIPTFLPKFIEEGLVVPEGVFGEGIKVSDLVAELNLQNETKAKADRVRFAELAKQYEKEDATFVSENPGKPFGYADQVAPPGMSPVLARQMAALEGKSAKSGPTPADTISQVVYTRLSAKRQFDKGSRGKEVEKGREETCKEVRALVEQVCIDKGIQFTFSETKNLADEITEDVLGLGPIQKLIDDEEVAEVMVNGPDYIYVERRGKLIRTDVKFRDDDHARQIVTRIVTSVGRRIDEQSPLCDARLLDGSRVNAVIPPVSLHGPILTIRKFAKVPISIQKLIDFGAMTKEMAAFLEACVCARLNIVVAGGTGSGKTTTLNALSSFIPGDERVVTIEDAAELQLQQDHVVSLESRPANQEGKGEVSIRDLVKNSLRMRPERVVIGECRGGECLDMLQAMNTGHDGSLTTAHANTPKDVISRLETMVMMAGLNIPVRNIREQIASAVNLIVQQSRLKDGSRKLVNITEVRGMKGDQVDIHNVFEWRQEGISPAGKVIGKLVATGYIPSFVVKLKTAGIELPEETFGPGTSLSRIIAEREQEELEAHIAESARLRALIEGQPEDVPSAGARVFSFMDVVKEATGAAEKLEAREEKARLVKGSTFASLAKRKRVQLASTDARDPEKEKAAALHDSSFELLLNDREYSIRLAQLDPKTEDAGIRHLIRQAVDEMAGRTNTPFPEKVRREVSNDIYYSVTGFGPIQPLLDRNDVSEVMVNSKDLIYYETKGKLVRADVEFKSDEHILHVINKIVSPLGRRCDMSSPMVDARLPDGSRVNAIIPPLALKGPSLTIRKFSETAITVAQMVTWGTLTQGMSHFLEACVRIALNIVVSGGTGSGKTTTLNAISGFIPEGERIVTVEDSAELNMQQNHVVSLETRPPNVEGKGAVTIRELIKNCLRMRPDRVVVGECRSGETLDMLQAMNTGHEGSLTTGHANTPKDMMTRLEVMVMMAGTNMPSRAIREQIASAVDLVVQQVRLHDGSRRLTYITTVTGLKDDKVQLEDIFRFQQEGLDANGKILGKYVYTGARPEWFLRFRSEGVVLPDDVFGEGYSYNQIIDEMEAEHQVAMDLRESERLETLKREMRADGSLPPEGVTVQEPDPVSTSSSPDA